MFIVSIDGKKKKAWEERRLIKMVDMVHDLIYFGIGNCGDRNVGWSRFGAGMGGSSADGDFGETGDDIYTFGRGYSKSNITSLRKVI